LFLPQETSFLEQKLEQYHLLNKRFNLNTQRVVNFRAVVWVPYTQSKGGVNQGTDIYLYDIERKIFFYASKSLNQIRGRYKG
jgi:hypothetical protein